MVDIKIEKKTHAVQRLSEGRSVEADSHGLVVAAGLSFRHRASGPDG